MSLATLAFTKFAVGNPTALPAAPGNPNVPNPNAPPAPPPPAAPDPYVPPVNADGSNPAGAPPANTGANTNIAGQDPKPNSGLGDLDPAKKEEPGFFSDLWQNRKGMLGGLAAGAAVPAIGMMMGKKPGLLGTLAPLAIGGGLGWLYDRFGGTNAAGEKYTGWDTMKRLGDGGFSRMMKTRSQMGDFKKNNPKAWAELESSGLAGNALTSKGVLQDAEDYLWRDKLDQEALAGDQIYTNIRDVATYGQDDQGNWGVGNVEAGGEGGGNFGYISGLQKHYAEASPERREQYGRLQALQRGANPNPGGLSMQEAMQVVKDQGPVRAMSNPAVAQSMQALIRQRGGAHGLDAITQMSNADLSNLESMGNLRNTVEDTATGLLQNEDGSPTALGGIGNWVTGKVDALTGGKRTAAHPAGETTPQG